MRKLACSGIRDKQRPFRIGLPVLKAHQAVNEKQILRIEAFEHFRNVTLETVRLDPWRPMRLLVLSISVAASPMKSIATGKMHTTRTAPKTVVQRFCFLRAIAQTKCNRTSHW